MTFKEPFCRHSGKLQKQNFCWPLHPFQLYSGTERGEKKKKISHCSLLVTVCLLCQHFRFLLQIWHFLCNYFKAWILWDVKVCPLWKFKFWSPMMQDWWWEAKPSAPSLGTEIFLSTGQRDFYAERCVFRFLAVPVLGLSTETTSKWLLNTCQAAATFSPQFIIMQIRYSAVNPGL